MKKKLLSVCFILAAVLSLMTVTALAADPTTADGLKEEISQATGTHTVNLGGDITMSDGLSITSNPDSEDGTDKLESLTIDLNNKQLTLGPGGITVKGVALTIKGGTIVGSGSQSITVQDGGTLTVESGNIKAPIGTQSTGKIIIKSGVFSNSVASNYVPDGYIFRLGNNNVVVPEKADPEAVVVHPDGSTSGHDTLDEAVTAAETNGDVVWLRKSIKAEKDIPITVRANITLELSQNITLQKKSDSSSPESGSLQIGVASGAGPDAGVTINGGAIEQVLDAAAPSGAVQVNGGTVTINGTKITGYKYGVEVENSGKLTVGAGSITGGVSGIYVGTGSSGALTVNGGAVTGSKYGIQADGGTLKVSGGATVSAPIALYFGNGAINANIDGGTFTGTGTGGKSVVVEGTVTPRGFISGGRFVTNVNRATQRDPLPIEHLAANAVQGKDGTVSFRRPEEIIIIFDALGGTFADEAGAKKKVTVAADSRLSDWPANPTLEGQGFAGWFTGEHGGEGKETEVVSSRVFTNIDQDVDKNTNTITVHAHWKPLFTVTFDPANGTFEDGSREGKPVYVRGDGKLPPENIPKDPTRDGWKFAGWYTAAEGGERFSSDWSIGESITVYAHWDKLVKVIFDAGEGYFPKEPNYPRQREKEVQVVEGGTLSEEDLPAEPIRDDYTFAGWYISAYGEDKFDFTEPITGYTQVYAHWGYKITFDANANDGLVTIGEDEEAETAKTVTVMTDEDGILSEWPEASRPGWQFDGWYTKAADGDEVEIGTPFVKGDNNKILYAHWTKYDEVKLTSDTAVLVASSPENPSPDLPIVLTVGGTKFKEGAAFEGEDENRYFTLALNGGATGLEVLKAEFVADGETEDSTVDYTKIKIVLSGVPGARGTLKISVSKAAFEGLLEKDLTVEIPVVYEITFDKNQGEFGKDVAEPVTALTGIDGRLTEEALSKIPEPTRENWEFAGWYWYTDEEQEEEAVKVTAGEKGTVFDGNVNVYARWSKTAFYAITFDAAGGKFEDGGTTKEATTDKDGYLGKNDLEGLIPTWEPTEEGGRGYTFAGWYITPEDGEHGDDCEKVTVDTRFNKDAMVHAHWQLSPPYTVTFNPNDGVTEGENFYQAETTVTAADNLSARLAETDWPGSDPEREGYEFLGWYTDVPGAKGAEKADKAYPFTKDTMLFAHWGVVITFDPNNGSTATEDSPFPTATTGGDGKLSEEDLSKVPKPTPSGAGNVFAGWYTDPERGNPVTAATVFTKRTTVYARWARSIDLTVTPSEVTLDNKVPEFTLKIKTEELKFVSSLTKEQFTLALNGEAVEGVSVADVKRVSDTEATITLSAALSGGGTLTITVADTAFDTRHAEDASVDVIVKCIVTFNANGGKFKDEEFAKNPTLNTDKDGKLSTLPTPERDGYTFDGWFTAVSGGEQVKANETVFAKNATVYAHWTKNAEDPGTGDDKDTYTVTVDKTENGTVKADKTEAKAGDTVTLTVTPAEGYELDTLTVKDAGGKEVKVEDGKFTMPASNVKVTAAFKATGTGGDTDPGAETTYTIQIASGSQRGKVSTSHTAAKKGTTVEVTIYPDTDCEVDRITISQTDGTSVPKSGSGNRYTFTMPASNVTIEVTFSLRPEYNNFVPPQTRPQSQTQAGAQATLPTSAFQPVTWRPAAALRDVPPNSWAYPAAQWAYQNGYLDTAADGTFRLNDTVSHMQLWRIMARWQGEASLDDNSVTQWARKTGASRFGTASGAMTRQNMVEYLYQCYFLMGGDVTVTGNLMQYHDNQLIASAATKNAWIWAVNKGIISGTPDGSLNPNGILSRGEFASILMRLCQKG